MALEVLSSPRKRTQGPTPSLPQTVKKAPKELGSWATVLERHRFLLTVLAILGVLCTIYLYFAVTIAGNGTNSCSDLSGTEKALCRLNLANFAHRKLKFF